ncbi:tripartite tricarboxylate transporter substrate binding protein [Tianweitania sp. BSSL-BM11]|uniref:Tripartite tricarboxylate transporter substrate binding protein n=1 Tax=Tianweitania aestuarii TaxID=2814886 RepID=A0ABS5RYL4_9HYPH|nr:tripartite tricarboxylate transporter substrate binding protein [Tianweitania aestuarii]MBS9722077.1 tripartite tricarboxylate transporter substrate binding protein [Tianweitania aestuarii]
MARDFRRAIVRTVSAAGIALAALTTTCLPQLMSQAQAEGFPEKPIRVIVPFKPGGRTDVVARLIADKIQEKGWLEQPMVIVNADGGAGANAIAQLQRGEPDGYTIMHWSHEILMSIAMNLGNFKLEDFRSIGLTGGGSPLWAVRKDAPYKSLEEVVTALKEKPRSLVEAVGIGSIPHFIGAMLAQEAGFETRYVTANSNADRLRLLLGNNADIALFAASEYVTQGKDLNAIVYFGRERSPALPDVPTATELGYNVVWANPNWWLAPAGTPDEAVQKIAGALEKAINDPEIIEYFKQNTLDPYWTDGETAMTEAQETLGSLRTVAERIQ